MVHLRLRDEAVLASGPSAIISQGTTFTIINIRVTINVVSKEPDRGGNHQLEGSGDDP
jgi:hypothetical protein